MQRKFKKRRKSPINLIVFYLLMTGTYLMNQSILYPYYATYPVVNIFISLADALFGACIFLATVLAFRDPGYLKKESNDEDHFY